MDIFRYLLTILLFVSGAFCLIRFLVDGFNFIFLVVSLVCFLLAYWVKPKRENHDRKNDTLDWLDVIDITVEVVYWIVTLPFRLLRGIFDSSSPDIP
ncbi:MAG: hypothetical protein BGN93_08310 [Acinetobacter sp. 39-4]|nr:MAG: hypothetical protein BGN93_08310 [Acinetobacter sp. 39-4]OJU98338.1 MAG: hypothetical protein BGO19_07800 [Acinetobacter sp. 38-8]